MFGSKRASRSSRIDRIACSRICTGMPVAAGTGDDAVASNLCVPEQRLAENNRCVSVFDVRVKVLWHRNLNRVQSLRWFWCRLHFYRLFFWWFYWGSHGPGSAPQQGGCTEQREREGDTSWHSKPCSERVWANHEKLQEKKKLRMLFV